MSDSSDILRILEEQAPMLTERYGVKRLGVFGSVVRRADRPDSDVDVLVEFDSPTFDGYMDLKFELEDLLDRKVDLVMAKTLKPALRDKVLAEARYVA